MFEEKRKGNWNYTWGGIIVVVVLIVAVFQIVRMNRPEPVVTREQQKPIWTEGEVLKGSAEVAGGSFLSFPINLNRKATLKVFYTTGKNDRRLAGALIRAADLDAWKAGGDVPAINTTGVVPRGQISTVLDPGNYVLLLDNRMNKDAIKLEETDIRVE